MDDGLFRVPLRPRTMLRLKANGGCYDSGLMADSCSDCPQRPGNMTSRPASHFTLWTRHSFSLQPHITLFTGEPGRARYGGSAGSGIRQSPACLVAIDTQSIAIRVRYSCLVVAQLTPYPLSRICRTNWFTYSACTRHCFLRGQVRPSLTLAPIPSSRITQMFCLRPSLDLPPTWRERVLIRSMSNITALIMSRSRAEGHTEARGTGRKASERFRRAPRSARPILLLHYLTHSFTSWPLYCTSKRETRFIGHHPRKKICST